MTVDQALAMRSRLTPEGQILGKLQMVSEIGQKAVKRKGAVQTNLIECIKDALHDPKVRQKFTEELADLMRCCEKIGAMHAAQMIIQEANE